MRTLMLTAALLLTACSGEDTSSDIDVGCDACVDGEYCLVYFADDGTESEECATLPAACAGDDSCECRGEMYDGCEDPFFGVGCSDTLTPTTISCNE